MTEQAAQAVVPTPEEGIEPDDLNTTMIVAIGLISTALLLASVLGVTALVDAYQTNEVDKKVNAVSYASVESTLNEQEIKLNGYDVDSATGVYQIPITEAKRLVVQELRDTRESAN